MIIANKFEKGKETHTYQRIDEDYKVNIFLGYNDDGKMSMVITENGNVENVKSSKIIDVKLKRREDKKLALSFDLQDAAYESMFLVFCRDMVTICEYYGKEKAISSAAMRWKYWKEMFGKRKSQLLDKQEIKGLLGELYVLKKFLAPQYGYKNAISGWMGPVSGHKDFEMDKTWYEVKTVNDGAVQISISSLEQLDAETDGHLVIVKADETSEISETGIDLNRIVFDIVDMISDPEVLDLFYNKLSDVGYYGTEEYYSFKYEVKGMDTYIVNGDFPKLKRNEINDAIGNVKYTMILSKLKDFKE